MTGTKIPRGKRLQRAPKAMPRGWTHPPCVVCEGPVERRPGETPSSWRDRKTCSLSCGGKAAGRGAVALSAERWIEAEAAHPPCVICGGPVRKREREYIERYRVRATCSAPCQKAHQAAVSGGKG